MRIFLIGDFPPDPRFGSAKVLHKLRDELRAAGHTCDAAFADDLGTSPRQRHLRDATAPWLAVRAVGRAVRAAGAYDVVDIAGAEGAAFAWLRRWGRFEHTAFVSRSNGLEHLNYRRLLDDHAEGLAYKPWTRRLWYPAVRLSQVSVAARHADRLLLPAELDRRFAAGRRWKRDEEIDVVPHGISSRFLGRREVLGAPRGAGVLFCGSWDHVKGVTYLVSALGLALAAGTPFRLTVLGGGLPAARILSAFPLDTRPFVTVVDRAGEDEVMTHYTRHDLLVSPSTYEGFGMVVPEAMSQGLPVVATQVGAAAALVQDGVTGLVVPPRDPAALAAAIRRGLADPVLGRRLAARAFEAVQDLTWERTAALTLESYRRARSGRHRGGA